MKGYAKAITGGLLAGLAAAAAALSDGYVSPVEICTILSSVVVGFSGVYRIPNAVAAAGAKRRRK